MCREPSKLLERPRWEKTDGEVARGAQAGGRLKNCRDGVDGHRSGGDVSMRAAWNDQADIRMALEFDGVGGIFRAHVHLQLHIDEFLAAGKPASNLVDAGGLPGFDGEEFRFYLLGGYLWLDRFDDFVHRQ